MAIFADLYLALRWHGSGAEAGTISNITNLVNSCSDGGQSC